MHPSFKKKLAPLLHATTSYVDSYPFLQRVLRHIPIYHKLSIVRRLSNYPKSTIANCLGVNYELDLTDLLQREIYFNCYDSKQLPLLLRYITAGQTYIDVGANVGFYSLHIAKKIKGNGRIYSFEPDPMLYKSLHKNYGLNTFARTIKIYNLAITNCVETMPFYVHHDGASGEGSLTRFPRLTGKSITVDTMTIDRFLEIEKIEKVNFIKIDIEGNEFELLEGAKHSLKDQCLEKIYIEFNGPLQMQKGRTLTELLELFADYGYQPGKLNQKILHQLRHGRLDPNQVVTDFLFVPGIRCS